MLIKHTYFKSKILDIIKQLQVSDRSIFEKKNVSRRINCIFKYNDGLNCVKTQKRKGNSYICKISDFKVQQAGCNLK